MEEITISGVLAKLGFRHEFVACLSGNPLCTGFKSTLPISYRPPYTSSSMESEENIEGYTSSRLFGPLVLHTFLAGQILVVANLWQSLQEYGSISHHWLSRETNRSKLAGEFSILNINLTIIMQSKTWHNCCFSFASVGGPSVMMFAFASSNLFRALVTLPCIRKASQGLGRFGLPQRIQHRIHFPFFELFPIWVVSSSLKPFIAFMI